MITQTPELWKYNKSSKNSKGPGSNTQVYLLQKFGIVVMAEFRLN